MPLLSVLFVSVVGCRSEEVPVCDDADRLMAFADRDGDGFGRAFDGMVCAIGAGQAANNIDCNDTLFDVFPGAPEVCDGADNDCDGEADEGFERQTWYADVDGDGFGDDLREFTTCEDPGSEWVSEGGDCDDTNALVNPANEEVCDNGLDDDCDLVVDYGEELCADGIDNNCDNLVDCDDALCASVPPCLAKCADAGITVAPFPFSIEGDTSAATADWTGTCTGAGSPDLAYQFIAPATGRYVFDTQGTGYDTVLHAYDGCDGAVLDCNDDTFGLQSEIFLDLQAGQVAIVIVDGFGSFNAGPFTLNIDAQ